MASSNSKGILFIFLMIIIFPLTPIANSETVTKGCDESQCFSTQFTLYDVKGEKTNYMYEINDEWYDNYSALELMAYVFSAQNMTYETYQSEPTGFLEVNGSSSNSYWDWVVYIDEDGMWVSTDLAVDQIIMKNINNHAVSLTPSAKGTGHNPFSQSIEDWLMENSVDEYFHSSGKVNSEGELEGITSNYQPWVVRTTGELLGTSLSEIEMRVEGGDADDQPYSEEEVLVSMVLSNGTENMSGVGSWWEMTWNDVDEDGKLSVGDSWALRTSGMDTHGTDWYATFVHVKDQNYDIAGVGMFTTIVAIGMSAFIVRKQQ